jgi:hypothetical protein
MSEQSALIRGDAPLARVIFRDSRRRRLIAKLQQEGWPIFTVAGERCAFPDDLAAMIAQRMPALGEAWRAAGAAPRTRPEKREWGALLRGARVFCFERRSPRRQTRHRGVATERRSSILANSTSIEESSMLGPDSTAKSPKQGRLCPA